MIILLNDFSWMRITFWKTFLPPINNLRHEASYCSVTSGEVRRNDWDDFLTLSAFVIEGRVKYGKQGQFEVGLSFQTMHHVNS